MATAGIYIPGVGAREGSEVTATASKYLSHSRYYAFIISGDIGPKRLGAQNATTSVGAGEKVGVYSEKFEAGAWTAVFDEKGTITSGYFYDVTGQVDAGVGNITSERVWQGSSATITATAGAGYSVKTLNGQDVRSSSRVSSSSVSVTASSDMFVSAEFEKYNQFTLVADGGTGGTWGGDVPSSVAIVYAFENRPGTITTRRPTRSGYSFAGWKVGNSSAPFPSGNVYQPGDQIPVQEQLGSLRLYSTWKKDSSTIQIYDGVNNNNVLASITIDYEVGSTVANLPNLPFIPTRTGFAFAGVYGIGNYNVNPYTPNGTEFWNADGTPNTTWDASNNGSLVCAWTPYQYDLRLNTNGGTFIGSSGTDIRVTNDSQKLVYGGKNYNAIATCVAPDRTYFLGYWVQSADGSPYLGAGGRLYDGAGQNLQSGHWTANYPNGWYCYYGDTSVPVRIIALYSPPRRYVSITALSGFSVQIVDKGNEGWAAAFDYGFSNDPPNVNNIPAVWDGSHVVMRVTTPLQDKHISYVDVYRANSGGVLIGRISSDETSIGRIENNGLDIRINKVDCDIDVNIVIVGDGRAVRATITPLVSKYLNVKVVTPNTDAEIHEVENGASATFKAAWKGEGGVAPTGVSFLGWYNAETGGSLVDANMSYTVPNITADTTLYARVAVAVTFIAGNNITALTVNGAAHTSGNPVNVNLGDTISFSATVRSPEEGNTYVFDGWYDGGDKIYGVNEQTIAPTEPMTLTAKAIERTAEKSTVTIAMASGSTTEAGEISIIGGDGTYSKEVNFGADVTILAVPSAGYKFVGWYVTQDAQGSEASTDAEYTFSATRDAETYYAKFAQDRTKIYEWEGDDENKVMVWRSKTYEGSKPFAPSAVRVDTLKYDSKLYVEVGMFSAPDAEATDVASLPDGLNVGAIESQEARRLPPLRAERYMQVEVRADSEVDALLVGTSAGGLAT